MGRKKKPEMRYYLFIDDCYEHSSVNIDDLREWMTSYSPEGENFMVIKGYELPVLMVDPPEPQEFQFYAEDK